MFKQPSEDDRLTAIGIHKNGQSSISVKQLNAKADRTEPNDLFRAIQPDSSRFLPIPTPNSDDWLANHEESGQTFEQYGRGDVHFPDSRRNTIYIVPLTFFEDAVPDDVLNRLVEFATIFFSMTVKVQKIEHFAGKVDHRTNSYTEKVQVNAGQILSNLEKIVAKDAFCTSAITLCDLYPEDSWNFVFGLASISLRVGVYSLARYLPGFDEGSASKPSNLSGTEMSQLLKRSCLLMCHEIGHMFGMKHCIYYHCLMNGSNHFEESDKKPLHLCPVCLRKLHFCCQFDVADRYSRLAEFCKASGITAEQEWFESSFRYLKSGNELAKIQPKKS